MADNIRYFNGNIVIEVIRKGILYKKKFELNQIDEALEFRDKKRNLCKHSRFMTSSEKAAIIEDVMSGMSLTDVGKKHNRSINTISKALSDYLYSPSIPMLFTVQSRLNTMTDEECEKEFKNYLDFKS